MHRQALLAALLLALAAYVWAGPASPVAYRHLRAQPGAPNLLHAGDAESAGWRAFERGFQLAPGEGRGHSGALLCENANEAQASGATQTIELNQTSPVTVTASGWSRAQNVSGVLDAGYALYIDITYADGSNLWGQTASFEAGTHGWQRVQLSIFPARPIRSVSFYALLRGHSGRAWFDDMALTTLGGSGATLLDGTSVQPAPPSKRIGKYLPVSTRDGLSLLYSSEDADVSRVTLGGRDVTGKYLQNGALRPAQAGLMLRQASSDGDWLRVQNSTCPQFGVQIHSEARPTADGAAIAITLRVSKMASASARDRALTVLWALPLDATGWKWSSDIQSSLPIGAEGEFSDTFSTSTGVGRWSLYPFASVSDEHDGVSLALDPTRPAQHRLFYNARAQVLGAAFDIALVPERPGGEVLRFLIMRSGPSGMRGAIAKWWRQFPQVNAVRASRHGLWMPFTDVSKVPAPEDFGFAFHEGDDAIAWDDAHSILSFHYTEPSTWWMPMPPALPRTYENALALARSIAADAKNPQSTMASALLKWGMKDADGRLQLQFRNEPWANGAVWSLNPSPRLSAPCDFSEKSGPAETARLYSPARGGLDGEYLDSLEGYVTAEADFNRAAFASVSTPPTWSSNFAPTLHKGLLLFERASAMSQSLHARSKLLMANSTPDRFGFFAPCLDVLGSETNWGRGGKYLPDDDSLMARRRALSGGKPFCLLQNTDFDKFGPHVEAYFARCLFYGFWPGFFSPDASSGPYFESARWFERDRPLFVKYLPLIKSLSQAGWQPLTQAHTSRAEVWIERFGSELWTLRNTERATQSVDLSFENAALNRAVDLMSGQAWDVRGGILRGLELPGGATRVLRVQ